MAIGSLFAAGVLMLLRLEPDRPAEARVRPVRAELGGAHAKS
jgi:hypothetical protein